MNDWYFKTFGNYKNTLLNPSWIHEIALSPSLFNTDIGAFLLFTNPFLDVLLALLCLNRTFENLERIWDEYNVYDKNT